MVTVAVIGIMAGSVVVGFSSFGNVVRVRETAGVLSDTVKRLELETIRRDYLSNLIHFEEDYLVVESAVEGQTITLEYKGIGGGGCEADEAELEVANNSGSPYYLAQRDQYGNNMEISNVADGDTETICVDFNASDEIEWQYQVFQGSDVSQVVRFLHFNIRRDSTADPVQITAGNQYSLEIAAPYAKKTFYDSGNQTNPPINLTLDSTDVDPETVTLQ